MWPKSKLKVGLLAVGLPVTAWLTAAANEFPAYLDGLETKRKQAGAAVS